MIRSLVHNHSVLCDGTATLAEMAAEAYRLGLKTFGFSGHSYVPEEPFGMNEVALQRYTAECKRLKEEYSGKMDILCGIELDSQTPPELFPEMPDYVIGSCHCVRGTDGILYTLDESPAQFERAIQNGFNGNVMRLIAAYYNELAEFAEKIKPDIIGHLDIVRKFNGSGKYFDTDSREYRESAIDSVNRLLKTGAVFEVNTGAMARGYTKTPYPQRFLLEYILKNCGRVMIAADAHATNNITAFEYEAINLLKEVGFSEVEELTVGGFKQQKI